MKPTLYCFFVITFFYSFLCGQSKIHSYNKETKVIVKSKIALELWQYYSRFHIDSLNIIGLDLLENYLKKYSTSASTITYNKSSIVIVGRPNAGKSTLFNALLNNKRSSVSNVPGTTRDKIVENINLNSGLSNLYEKINSLDKNIKERLIKELEYEFKTGPEVAMVNSENNISNFHIPSDVIIDASMPAMIKSSGKMWNKKGDLKDTKAVIPDSSYASIYQATIEFCKKNGEFDPSTMGTVQNVGLMAKKAEEYGSHDKTFEIKETGKVCVETKDGKTLFTHNVSKGDIWRMCIVRSEAIVDWIKLAINRAKKTKYPTVFWLDEKRAHDKQLIKVVKKELNKIDTSSLDIQILSPYKATVFTLEMIKKGESVISVSGNVLRDYLTDLFPILELGTSAKMLSIVPLMNGGKLFETGAGGSAPKHVQQLNNENHLRWDSLGEFLAISVALENIGVKNKNSKILSTCLTNAIEKLLTNQKSPSRKVGEIDNRGSHFYLALFWSEFLSNQNENILLKKEFSSIYKNLSENEKIIMDEINEKQGVKVNLEGYYKTDDLITNSIMRPSLTFNAIIDNI